MNETRNAETASILIFATKKSSWFLVLTLGQQEKDYRTLCSSPTGAVEISIKREKFRMVLELVVVAKPGLPSFCRIILSFRMTNSR